MHYFLMAWGIAGFLIIVLGLFNAGYDQFCNKEELIVSSFLTALFLPAIIIVGLICLPFIVIYNIGFYMRNRKWKMQEKRG